MVPTCTLCLCALPAVCTATSSCPPMTLPDGTVIPASGCTSDSITPVLNEFSAGKSLSCTCGGDDASTEYICAQQPGTVLDIAFWPAGASGQRSNGNASARVYERAGLYSAVSEAGKVLRHTRTMSQPYMARFKPDDHEKKFFLRSVF